MLRPKYIRQNAQRAALRAAGQATSGKGNSDGSFDKFKFLKRKTYSCYSRGGKRQTAYPSVKSFDSFHAKKP